MLPIGVAAPLQVHDQVVGLDPTRRAVLGLEPERQVLRVGEGRKGGRRHQRGRASRPAWRSAVGQSPGRRTSPPRAAAPSPRRVRVRVRGRDRDRCSATTRNRSGAGSVQCCRPGGGPGGSDVPQARRSRRAGDPGQARGRPARPRLPVRPGPPPDRGRPRRRQDLAREGDRAVDRRHVAAHPVHPRPAAHRRDRRVDLEPGDERVRVPARRRVRHGAAGRRDQPGLAQDAVGPARGHGGGPGHRRRPHLSPGSAVHGHRHPEPDRARGDLSPARGAARPLPHAARDRLPRPRRRGRHPRGGPRPRRRSRTSSR